MTETPPIIVVPATAQRWPDLETLFGARGAYSGCWCMFWRLRRSNFIALKAEERKAALRSLTLEDRVPGVLAYAGKQAVGWCSLGPRRDFAALEASRLLKRIDEQPVWSLVCFYLAKPYRHGGLMRPLLLGALEYARQQGAKIVEGYPVDLQSPRLAGQTLKGCSGFMGIVSAFRSAGFVEVGRASETQLIMRCLLS